MKGWGEFWFLVVVAVLAIGVLTVNEALSAPAQQAEPVSLLCQAVDYQRDFVKADPNQDWDGYIKARDAFWKFVAKDTTAKKRGWSGWKDGLSPKAIWEARQQKDWVSADEDKKGWIGTGECYDR